MKRILVLFVGLLMVCGTVRAQQVFTVVYATSDDGFVNVRSQPSNYGTILTTVNMMFHGLGDGVLLERGASWSKVKAHGKIGWCYNKYLGYQTWYKGTGRQKLVSKWNNTPIYADSDGSGQGGYMLFTTIGAGIIIADYYQSHGDYWLLPSGHDPLLVRKSDVTLR